jgi:Aminoacyl tRNA synthetase class II, N-terminal domain
MSIPDLQREIERDIASIKNTADLRAVRDRYLSRKSGTISVALKELGSASPEDRRTRG